MILMCEHDFFIALYILALYRKGLLYLDVPIADEDCIVGMLRENDLCNMFHIYLSSGMNCLNCNLFCLFSSPIGRFCDEQSVGRLL